MRIRWPLDLASVTGMCAGTWGVLFGMTAYASITLVCSLVVIAYHLAALWRLRKY